MSQRISDLIHCHGVDWEAPEQAAMRFLVAIQIVKASVELRRVDVYAGGATIRFADGRMRIARCLAELPAHELGLGQWCVESSFPLRPPSDDERRAELAWSGAGAVNLDLVRRLACN